MTVLPLLLALGPMNADARYLTNANVFAPGGVGFGNEPSRESLRLRRLMDAGYPSDRFVDMARSAPTVGRLYAIFALRMREDRRASSLPVSRGPVRVRQGCEVFTMPSEIIVKRILANPETASFRQTTDPTRLAARRIAERKR